MNTNTGFLELRAIEDFAELMNMPGSVLREVILQSQSSYRYFTIPKKRGGVREIEAPSGLLMEVQIKMNGYLQPVYQRIRPECSHGFISNEGKLLPTLNVVTGATVHVGQTQLLNMDLEDFFHSIDAWRVKNIFMSYPFYFGNDFAACLAILTTCKERLPMGAPTSPVISNFACFMLDRTLTRFAETNGMKYTRYADDLSFSSKEPITEIHQNEIVKTIVNEGFKVNTKKTRLQRNTGKQTVTGLKVNEKVNVERKYIRSIRGMLNRWEKNGMDRALMANQTPQNFLNILQGKLGFLKMVKSERDPVYQRLHHQMQQLLVGIG